MAAPDVKNVYAAEPLAGGSLFVAPLETTAPTDASTALNASFNGLGFIGEEGFTETIERTTEDKKSFGGLTVKTLQTDFNVTYQFTMLDSLSGDVLKAVFGEENVTITPANASHGVQITVKKNANRRKKYSWVIDTQDSEFGARYRTYIPIGQIVTQEPVVIVHTDTIFYTVELKAFADASGQFAYTLTDNGQKTGS
jgi:hypothetical protein